MSEDLKQLQKKEALDRLKILHKEFQTMDSIVKEYEKDNTIFYSEYQNETFQGILYWISNNEEFECAIKEFEEQNNALVYHAVLTPLTYGRTLTLLYVSQYQEEWKKDREELIEGLPLAYVINLDDENMSEFGGIQIIGVNGGISRIA